jgi:hypothetical protein
VKILNLGTIAALALSLFVSGMAHATPGDVLCIGETADQKKVEVVLGYDNFEQPTASFINVSVEGSQVVSFPEAAIEGKMINVGTEESPFMNWQQSGKDGENMIALRYPEQDPEADSVSIYLTLDVPSKKVSLSEVELSCEN